MPPLSWRDALTSILGILMLAIGAGVFGTVAGEVAYVFTGDAHAALSVALGVMIATTIVMVF